MLLNQSKTPWDKVQATLFKYLDATKFMFDRTEVLITPVRRVQGIRIDDEMIKKALSHYRDKLISGDGDVTAKNRILISISEVLLLGYPGGLRIYIILITHAT